MAESAIFTIFLGITLLFFVYYSIQLLYIHSIRHSLPEQKWMFIVIIALFFYQNPIFLPEFFFNTVAGQVSGQVVENLAYSSFLVIWLLIVDGISYKDHGYSYGFYFRKLIFGLVYFVCLTYVTLAPYFNVEVSAGEINQQKPEIAYLYLGFIFVTGVLTIFWFFWLIRRTYTTYQVLKRIPFLSTRYRQLTFRFMFFLSLLSVSYLTISLFVKRTGKRF